MLFIYLECDPEDQNFATVMFLLRNAQASEEDEGKQNPVDTLFAEIAQDHPEHIANQYWEAYKLAAGKTAKSILIYGKLASEALHAGRDCGYDHGR